MTSKWTLYGAFGVGALLGLLAGCQTYDFEPVTPAAYQRTGVTAQKYGTNSKPNLMLVLDKSGSMQLPVDRSDPACPSYPDGGTCGMSWGSPSDLCPSNCKTRISELKLAMKSFLSDPTSGSLARYGLAAFPNLSSLSDSANVCRQGVVVQDVPSSAVSDAPDQLLVVASQVNDTIQKIGTDGGLVVGGGTPTAATLAQLVNQPSLASDAGIGRKSFLLLLTDGLPNCNDGLDNKTCTCVFNSCPSPIGCLDDAATVSQIQQLHNKGIDTFVVGFAIKNQSNGSADAQAVLNSMAIGGGRPRKCVDGNSCAAGDTCDPTTFICQTAFYTVDNASDLTAVLAAISAIVDVKPCEEDLTTVPKYPDYIQVTVNGAITASGSDTWTYDAAKNAIILQGALCTQVMSATPSNPVDVQYAFVDPL